MTQNNQPLMLGQAFISCSLRSQDLEFTNFIEQIVLAHYFQPFGTVGKYDASPANPAELMRINIPLADIIVLVATKRYLTEDVHTGKTDTGISEMIHVESGMGFALNKPIIVFVQKGAAVGNFLPNVTQYIQLDGTHADLCEKWQIINAIFANAAAMVQNTKEQRSSKEVQSVFGTGLAVFGAFKLLEYFVDSETEPSRGKRKRIAPKKTIAGRYGKINNKNSFTRKP